MFDFFYYKEKFQDLLYVFLTQLFKDVKATMFFFMYILYVYIFLFIVILGMCVCMYAM